MTVIGATTARIASATYTPPFQSVSTNPAAVQITGSVTSPVSNNPTLSAGTSDSDYAWAYLQAHMMSPPSYRYAYLLWMVLAFIAILYAVAHHLRLSGGSIGAAFSKFGMRRHTLGSKKPGRRHRALPSNNILLMLAIITIVTLVLCLIGADYIAPTSSILDFSTSFKRAASSATSPQYTISKSFWTLGSRFGFMAFALFPAVVLFALKAPPAALLALRALTQLHADKLSILHRGVAWLLWAITTAHVALWTVQLFQDSNNGRATWFYLWTNYRFIFGCVAYAALTGVMVMSLRPVRKHQYEFFYAAHVVLVILTLVACAIHHPVLWYWMVAAGGLWVLERSLRFLRFARINALFSKQREVNLRAGPHYDHIPDSEGYAMQDLETPFTDKTLPRRPPVSSGGTAALDAEFGTRSSSAYYDEGSLQPLGSYESRYGDHYNNDSYADPYAAYAKPPNRPKDDLRADKHERNRSSIATAPESLPAFTAPLIPTGFAQAQLLPSRTIRLTIKLPRPFRWAPGQSCLLYLPQLSKFQSHPFTIVNNNEPEIILLVKARKGLTRRLFNYVRSKSLASVGIQSAKGERLSLASMRGTGQEGMQVPPVNLRALVDGPFGSANRVRWHEYSTVVIICGGSGVSFGAAVCDHVCQMMSKNRDIQSRKMVTQRVRFCWVVREYAEIAWVAGQLYRCRQMVTPAQLEISIFVTNAGKMREDFSLPQPRFAKEHGRRDSQDSVASEMSQDPQFDIEELGTGTEDLSTQYADVIDLTNYDDEEDVNDPAEQTLSEQVQHQGKVRRARSRKAARARGPASSSYAQPRRGPSMLGLDDAAQKYAAAADPYSETDTLAPPLNTYGSRYNLRASTDEAPPPRFADDVRRQSYRSIADSTYGMYDPYGGMSGPGFRPSPSPSIINFDDTQSIAGESVRNLLSRASRTGSMVLLEDNGGDVHGDAGLWIDQADFAAMNVMSEMARPGKPKLSAVLEEEIDRSGGAIAVATCGPVTLNTVVRNLVSKHNSPARIRRGDKRGHIAIYSEDYES